MLWRHFRDTEVCVPAYLCTCMAVGLGIRVGTSSNDGYTLNFNQLLGGILPGYVLRDPQGGNILNV